jgi:hypothetical protein
MAQAELRYRQHCHRARRVLWGRLGYLSRVRRAAEAARRFLEPAMPRWLTRGERDDARLCARGCIDCLRTESGRSTQDSRLPRRKHPGVLRPAGTVPDRTLIIEYHPHPPQI